MKRVLPWIRWALRDQAMLLLVLCLVGLALPWNYFLQAAGEMLRELREQVQEKPLLTATGYVAVFTATTGLSVPGPTSLVFAVLGGWLFGWYAVPLSSLSSSLGACLSFLASRYWMTDATLLRYFPALQRFHEDRSHASWLVLLSARLNPLIPYFLENLYFGRTRIPLWKFWLVTLLGMLPITVLYVMTGRELAQVESYEGIVSWKLIACLVALSLLPLVALGYLPRSKADEPAHG